MAGNAVTHTEIPDLLHSGLAHGTDIAVAGRTLEAEAQVDRMDEVGVVGKLMDLVPQDRLSLLEGGDELFEVRTALSGDDLVALHAEFERRECRLGRGHRILVTIGAVQADCLHVHGMWKLNWLCFHRLCRGGEEVTPSKHESKRNSHDNEHDQDEQDQP